MRTFLLACCAVLLVDGCAHDALGLRRAADQPPQFNNRLRVSENCDIVGI